MLFSEIYGVQFSHRIDTVIWELRNLGEYFFNRFYIFRIPFAYEPEHLTLIIKLNLCSHPVSVKSGISGYFPGQRFNVFAFHGFG